jgi:hypothetical protein
MCQADIILIFQQRKQTLKGYRICLKNPVHNRPVSNSAILSLRPPALPVVLFWLLKYLILTYLLLIFYFFISKALSLKESQMILFSLHLLTIYHLRCVKQHLRLLWGLTLWLLGKGLSCGAFYEICRLLSRRTLTFHFLLNLTSLLLYMSELSFSQFENTIWKPKLIRRF